MLKNSFVSIILQEENKENRGSAEFQVVNFTNKIRKLTSHFELHKKDYLSQRGLRKILGKRQRLLAYLSFKIRKLTSHFELHKKDYLSQRGLRKILGKRQRLLAYLSKKNRIRYKELIDQLNIRETNAG
uniref:Small ribosomal subunit protein uS15c n=1 Tax=Morina alba TaxID=179859 RepID=A0A5P8G257_9DIPS|nr:ribosomal protein S15 [Acanthocalyx alba]QFQ36776.1 ribosomal protein S15 [Acanthocalyx alba]